MSVYIQNNNFCDAKLPLIFTGWTMVPSKGACDFQICIIKKKKKKMKVRFMCFKEPDGNSRLEAEIGSVNLKPMGQPC